MKNNKRRYITERRINKIIKERLEAFFDSLLYEGNKKPSKERWKKAQIDGPEMFKIYWEDASWLYTLFNDPDSDDPNKPHPSNPKGLNRLMYMYEVFHEEFFHSPMKDHGIIQLEQYILRAALPAGFQTVKPVIRILDELREIVCYIWAEYLMKCQELQKQKVASYKAEADKEIIDPILHKCQEICDPDNEEINDVVNRDRWWNRNNPTRLAQVRLCAQGYAIFKYLDATFGQKIKERNKQIQDALKTETFENHTDFHWTIDSNVDFKKMKEFYYPYTCEMCYGYLYSTWEEAPYANTQSVDGQIVEFNKLYVALMDGWQNIPAEHTECLFPEIFGESRDTPYDLYGLSMIFVWVTPDGRIASCNTRWNHQAVYTGYHSVDHPFDEVELSKVLGVNFNQVFKGQPQYKPQPDYRIRWFKDEENVDESVIKRNTRKTLREFYHQTEDDWMADDYFNQYPSDDDMYSDYLRQDYDDYTDSMDFDEYPSEEADNDYYGQQADMQAPNMPQQQSRFYVARNGERIPYPSKVNLNEKKLNKIITENIKMFFNKNTIRKR